VTAPADGEIILSAPDMSAAARGLGARGGTRGGPARAASLSPARRSEIARKAAAARWGLPPPVVPERAWSLEQVQADLSETRRQIALLQRKARALAKFEDALTAAAQAEAEALVARDDELDRLRAEEER